MVDNRTNMTDWNLYAKILSGEDVEQTHIEKARKEQTENFMEAAEIWHLVEGVDTLKHIDSKKAFNDFKKKVTFEKRSVNILKPNRKINGFIKIAASVILVIGTGIAIMLINTSQITLSSVDVILEKTLPDGTEITLNANSSLKYNKNFGKKNRNVSFHGEAFFNVARNEALPFIISTKNARVEVVGTSFNLKDLYNDNRVIVTVNSGEVYFSSAKKSDKTLVEPGFVASLNKSTLKIDNRENEDPNYLAWKTKEMVFKETPLKEVAEVLEKVYNIKVQFQSENIKDLKLTANYNKQPLENVLNIISRTFNLGYKIKNDTILIYEKM